MLGNQVSQLTATLVGWWTAMAAAPWLSAAAVVGAAIILLLLGVLIGRLGRRRARGSGDPALRARIKALEAERTQLRADLAAGAQAAQASAPISRRSTGEAARDTALALRKKAEREAREARAALEAARAAEEAAAQTARAAEERARGLAERLAQLEIRANDVEAEAAAAKARATAAEAAAETAEQARQEASTEALMRLAAAFDGGQIALAPALAEAEACLGRHGDAMAVALRLRALDALGIDDPLDGLAAAERQIAAACLLTVAPEPAVIEELEVLRDSLATARRMDPAGFPEPQPGPGGVAAAMAGHMARAGLMRLAEAYWLRRAGAPGLDPAVALAAQAEAASAALWGGRWMQAIAIADRTLPKLSDVAEVADVLDLRLTSAQASLFAGSPEAADALRAIAEDAAEALGEDAELTTTAQKLAARALFETGDEDAANEFVESLRGGPIDPTTDPALRAARARGLMALETPKAARLIFEQLQRAAAKTPRTALGYRLDATEARLLDPELQEVPDGIDALARDAAAAFGARHPRAGQAALIRALALELDESYAAALDALDEAEALFLPRLDRAHRWRQTVEQTRARVREALAEIEAEQTSRSELSPSDTSLSDTSLSDTSSAHDAEARDDARAGHADDDGELPEAGPRSRRGAILIDPDDGDTPDDEARAPGTGRGD